MANDGIVCPLCGQSALARMSLVHTTVWKCNSTMCGLEFAHPQLNEQELASAYSNLYYPGHEAEESPEFGNTPKPTIHDFFRQLESRVGSLRGLRLLDYGCGRGALLEVAKEFGMQVCGIESDPQARIAARTIPDALIYSSINDLQGAEPDALFDVIILWTVIEHLRTPWTQLAQLRTFLQPSGWLLISTMDINCLRARIERAKWENYENPTHLYYFDCISLATAIRQAGFVDFSEWRLKLFYPQHGTLRRWLYDLCYAMHVSDGLFFLCRQTNEDWRGAPDIQPETFGVVRGPSPYSAVPPPSQLKTRS